MARYVVSLVKHEHAHKFATVEVEARNGKLARQEAKAKLSSAVWKEDPNYPAETSYTIEGVHIAKEPPTPTPGKGPLPKE